MTASIGIDVGTTKSCIAVFDDRGPTMIRNAESDRTTPSCVALSDGERPLVGVPATRQAVTNPTGVITSVMRLMGRKYIEIPSEGRIARYRTASGANGDAVVEVGGKRISAPE